MRAPAGVLLASSCLVAVAACSRREHASIAPRHALLITLDGVRPDHTSAYMYHRPTTAWPVDGLQQRAGHALALDDIAAAGVVFAEAWSPAEDQLSAIKALMTGRATPLGEIPTGLLDEHLTLAERLRGAGFYTAAFVTGEPLAGAGGFDQGFHEYEHRPSDADCLDWAGRWLVEHDAGDGRPLFVWIHLSDARPPRRPGSAPPVPGEEAASMDYVRLLFDDEYADALPALDFAEAYGGAASGSAIDLYDGAVAELASRLRTFLLAFQSIGEPNAVWEDTALVLAGVSGVELGEHGRSSSLFAPAMRVPLIVHHPPSAPGARVLSDLVQTTDVAPTLLDWLGVRAGAYRVRDGVGRSLVPLLTGEGGLSPRPAVSVAAEGARAASLRTLAWAAVWRDGPEPGAASVELFDRVQDPLELVDVAERYSEEVERLGQGLARILARVAP